MPKRRELEWNETQRNELEKYRDHDKRPYVRERCAAILKVANGQAPHQVALQGLLKRRQPDTVYQWLDWYEAAGVAGLIAHQQGGYRRGSL